MSNNECQKCEGTGYITEERKTLGGIRQIKSCCLNCYGTGKQIEKTEHKGLTIVKYGEKEYQIVEMKCDTCSLNQSIAIIDQEFQTYTELCDPEEDGTFIEYIAEGLADSENGWY